MRDCHDWQLWVSIEFKQSRVPTQPTQNINFEFSWKADLTHKNTQYHKCRTLMQGGLKFCSWQVCRIIIKIVSLLEDNLKSS